MDMDLFLSQIVATSPLAGVLGVWGWMSRRDLKEKDKEVKEKDTYIKALYEKMLDAYKENTKATTEMSQSINANTKVSETLIQIVGKK